MKSPSLLAALFAFLMSPCFVAQGEVIDLSTLAHGQAITAAHLGPFVSSVTSSGPNLGIAIYDTDVNGGADRDLEVDRGEAMMLQSEDSPGMTGTIFDNPNDEADGGMMLFGFTTGLTMQSIDVIDMDNGNDMTIVLTDSSSLTRTYEIPENWTGQTPGTIGWATLDLTSLAEQSGPGSGGDATGSQDDGFDATDVVSMSVQFSGSGAINNVQYVPEPNSLMLFSVVCLGMCRRRR